MPPLMTMTKSDLRRESGVLLPLFSLPSPYGIGAMGRAARACLDRLHESGQSWWQLLPLGPTGYGDSPYQSLSSQAGNPYLIDLDLLAEEGLLTAEEIGGDWGSDPAAVDYGLLFQRREQVLAFAWQRLKEPQFATLSQEFAAFCLNSREWLEDFALYAALKREFEHKPWYEWPEPLRWSGSAACPVPPVRSRRSSWTWQWDLPAEWDMSVLP